MAASDTRSCTIVDEATAQILSQKLDILLSYPVCAECLPMQTRAKDAKEKLAMIQVHFSTQCRPSETTEWSGRLRRAMYDAEECIDKFHLREASERSKALHMATWPIAALVSKYKLGWDLSVLVNKMKESCDEKFLKEKPASSSSHASVPWQGQKLARLTSFWDRHAPTNFLCREAKKEEIRERIKITEMYEQWSSIWGEQGTGKTFLARWAYNQAKYMGYRWRAWVHVSASMDPREFLLEILQQANNVAGDMKDMNIDEIRTKLRQKLAKINKYFIVLDDVQPSDIQLLQELLWSTPGYSQGHIITTTQDNSIAQYSGEQIELEKLSEDESQRMLAWKLHRVPDGQSFSNEKDILSMCRGLPLYISLLGGFLSNAGEHERMALAKEGSMITLLDILQLSCHKLPVHLKSCFIYMTLFPIGFPIPTRRLVRLWLAEGLLDSHCHDVERERTRQPEDVGETFILELADRNVIDVVSWRADGSPKACQMLTSLFDMICPIAMSTGFLHIHATSKSKDGSEGDSASQQQQPAAQLRERTKIRWLAEHTNIVTDNLDSNYPNLNLGHVRSFLSFYQRRGMLTKDISTFLRKMTSKTGYSLLRVLDLEGVYKPYLQDVLHKLVLLRYLGLRSTELDSIPSTVADLHHLETLDIKHTNITWLPSSLWKARKLRHLHLNWFYIDLKNILKACRNNAMALTKLRTLSGLVTGEVEENLMRDHIDSLTTLTTLKLYVQRSGGDTSGAIGKAVADWISCRLTNLQSLTFGVIQEAEPKKETRPAEDAEPAKGARPAKENPAKKESKPATLPIGPLPELSLANQHHDLLELYLLGQLNKPIWTQLLPGSLRVLTLSGSRVEADMMPELGGLLRNLRTLRLLANSFLGKSMRFIKDGFPSLKILKIWKLPELDTVIIEQGAMPNLKELDFRRLDVMQKVDGIKECKELENIYVVFKKDSQGFVDVLQNDIGKEKNVYKIEEIKTPELMDELMDDDISPEGDRSSWLRLLFGGGGGGGARRRGELPHRAGPGRGRPFPPLRRVPHVRPRDPGVLPLLSFLNQFFWYRRERLSVTSVSAQVAVVPLGHLMAGVITKRVFFQGSKWQFTLNPGPFNVKEITVFANSGAASVYAIHIISAVKILYRKEMSFPVALVVVLTTQVLGFGWAVLFRRYLVEPAAMWWPRNLVQISWFREIWLLSKSAFSEKKTDIHTKLMRRYKQYEAGDHILTGLQAGALHENPSSSDVCGTRAIAPFIVWLANKAFPDKEWIRLITMPVLLGAIVSMPPATAVNYTSWIIVGFLSGFIAYRYYRGWWSRHNYVLSGALDARLAFMAVLLYLCLGMKHVSLSWWGEDPDGCPLASCPTAKGVVVEGCPVF
ncbi:hypothetical protein NL676_006387 [Syzygium grande]|nr:hypothetical protein NL676_006387 [Syzygium grande]